VPASNGAQLLTHEKATHLTKLCKKEAYGVSGVHSGSVAATATHLAGQLRQRDVEHSGGSTVQVTRKMEVITDVHCCCAFRPVHACMPSDA
jgi:hypothetical protein